jgi:hypothetical protein
MGNVEEAKASLNAALKVDPKLDVKALAHLKQ